MKEILVRRGAYYDSVTLLRLSKEMGELEGVSRAVVAMATPTNRDLVIQLGWPAEAVPEASENDLLVAVEAECPESLRAAFDWLDDQLRTGISRKVEGYRPRTLRTAIDIARESNLVLISVPGAYAYRETRQALLGDRHVMLFSDNVSIDEEVALKALAERRGLLLMGPDCGTAILNGVCLGFANVVPGGPVGIVAASGTGAQEVSVLLARCGVGISQLIGTGGRDLSREVGGKTMLMGLRALQEDPNTQVIVLLSKPPAREVGEGIMAEAASSRKPVVVNFLGDDPGRIVGGSVKNAGTLEEAALLTVETVTGRKISLDGGFSDEAEILAQAKAEREKHARGQRYLRGLFVGGTLADEAVVVLREELGSLNSNQAVPGCSVLGDSGRSVGHTILDLGADEFTAGRGHPMIDPTVRNLRIVREAEDPEVAVLLLDVVIGYGSHPDPAGDVARVIEAAKDSAAREGRYLTAVASVCGTEEDPQVLGDQEEMLRSAGVYVFPSNAQACRFCRILLAGNGHG